VSIRALARYDLINAHVNQTNTFKHFALWMNAARQGPNVGGGPNIARIGNDFCWLSNRKHPSFY
jgi:hypothetical protein